MHSIAHYAAAIILTSALGAFILCLLVIRYGFTPGDDESLPARHRRFFVTRLGHAAGAVCFAITAALAGVTLTLASRAPAAPPPAATASVDLAPLETGHARLAHDLRTLDERMERNEAALAELRAATAVVPARRAAVQRAPGAARRVVVSRPPDDAGDVARAPAAVPAETSEDKGADAMPRATTDFSAAPPAQPGMPADRPSASTNALGPRAAIRFASESVLRLGSEIKKKAVTATRAVRDFFRDL